MLGAMSYIRFLHLSHLFSSWAFSFTFYYDKAQVKRSNRWESGKEIYVIAHDQDFLSVTSLVSQKLSHP